MNRYRWCLQIAATFDSRYRYDIIHDMWIKHYTKTDEDLFVIPLDSEKSYLYTAIKRSFYYWYYKEKKGTNKHSGVPYVYYQPDDLLETSDLESQISGKQLVELYREKYSKTLKGAYKPEMAMRIFDLLSQGYTQIAIAERLELGEGTVSHYKKRIKQLLE